ncbi:MAG: hypothetical protein ACK6CU_10525 [Deltaproteobacteria bacterium]|jgi:hypothetical protein
MHSRPSATATSRSRSDVDWPDVTLEALLEDAADVARTYGLDEIATRLAVL